MAEPPGEATNSWQYNHGTLYQYEDGNYYFSSANSEGGVDWQIHSEEGWEHHSTDDLHDSSGVLGEYASDVRDIAVAAIEIPLMVVGGSGSGSKRAARALGVIDDVAKVGIKIDRMKKLYLLQLMNYNFGIVEL